MPLMFSLLALGACNRGLPVPDDDDDTTDSAEPTPTADTAPPGACRTPEVEPNNTPEDATPLVLEQRGCGVLSGEPDVYSFELDDEGWAGFEVTANEGSIADVRMLLRNDDFAWENNHAWGGTTDVDLVFQAPAGPYTLTVTEQNGDSGERYTYQVLVTEVKAPVKWEAEEAEPNDASGEAEILQSGVPVFGTMQGTGLADQDWYRIAVPAGRQDVRIDVDAFEKGSAADLTAFLYDENLEELEVIVDGPSPGPRPDPEEVYASPGDEVLYLKLEQDKNGGQLADEGIDRWYVLTVTVEAP